MCKQWQPGGGDDGGRDMIGDAGKDVIGDAGAIVGHRLSRVALLQLVGRRKDQYSAVTAVPIASVGSNLDHGSHAWSRMVKTLRRSGNGWR